MTEEDFLDLLRQHDWGYQHSDDAAVYRAGGASAARIEAAMRANPELKEVYMRVIARRSV
ncbi:MAG: hypothetical protein WCG34_11315 [Leptolinea sp.]